MPCKNVCDYDGNRTIESIVHDTVTYFRNRGHKRDVPFEQAALALGLSTRKTWSIFYGQAFALLANECAAIERRFAQHLEERVADYAKRSDAVRAKLRQMDMAI